MNKTKKNGFLKVAGIMVVAMMLTTCIVSGTMAKYTSTGSTTTSVSVAKWDIKAGGKKLDTTLDALNFTIYDTVEDGGKYTNTDEHVKEATMIAPGTWGYTTIEIKNDGDVDAAINATLSSGAGLPEGMTVAFINGTAPENPDGVTGGTGAITQTLKPTESVTIVIAFKWVFEGHDENDMTFAETETLSLGALTITATQVD